VIGAAFELLDLVRALEPVRLVDLAVAAAIPKSTVYRLLTQLIDVGAVRREGTRYRLGASLLRLGAAAVPERQLRIAARRPVAELALRTCTAVGLSATVGTGAVLLDGIDAPSPLGLPLEPGTPIPAGTAMARVHGIGQFVLAAGPPKVSVDAGEVVARLNCVAAAVALPGGGRAVITAFLPGVRPPQALLEATWAAAARVAALLRDPPVPQPASTQ
jgi:DNA-binding IclR family transcriptional regulator